MKNINACLTSKSDEWSTPSNLYKVFLDQGYFDPCPRNYKFDGLLIGWCSKTYVNPPYSNVVGWVDKAIHERENGIFPIVMLLPARPDTQWFKRLVYCPYTSIYFIEGRLKFNDSKSAPFPSMFVIFSCDVVGIENKFWYLEKGILNEMAKNFI